MEEILRLIPDVRDNIRFVENFARQHLQENGLLVKDFKMDSSGVHFQIVFTWEDILKTIGGGK